MLSHLHWTECRQCDVAVPVVTILAVALQAQLEPGRCGGHHLLWSAAAGVWGDPF